MGNLLIIGSEGFIGRHCVNFFLEKGWTVFGCDLLDYPSFNYNYLKISRLQPGFEEIFADGKKYNACINAAGNGSVPVSINHPLTDFEANCTDVIHILELIRQHTPECKYIHLSSAAVYGNPQKLPIKEDSILLPLSPYGWHKLVAENICKEYSYLYNISIAVVRPFSVFGPGLRKQLLWDMYQKAKINNPVELWGDGTESRDFIYIKDLVNAIELIFKNSGNTFDVYNLASGQETTIAYIADNFYKELGNNTTYKFNHKARLGDPKNWRADISKLTDLGFSLNFSLIQGLKLTAEWIKKLD